MEYSFLQNFSSLLEVFTAIYVSMFLDDILKNIWTPDYKKKISQLIEGMKIPAISFFVKKVEDNIDVNAKDISSHMKRKATFLIVCCLSLLLLAGMEAKSDVLPQYGYMIVTLLSVIALILVFLGRWTFAKFSRVVLCIGFYVIVFILLYYTGVPEYFSGLAWLKSVDYTVAIVAVLTVVTLPVLWQLFLIWVYSSLYKGYMQEKISKEAYVYGKAYLAYKIKDMAALPKEYEMVAKDFVKEQPKDGDTSLNSLNSILVRRLERLCELPYILKVFFSWIKFNLRGRHNHEAEYIEAYGFDYEEISRTEMQGDNPQPIGADVSPEENETEHGDPANNEMNEERAPKDEQQDDKDAPEDEKES